MSIAETPMRCSNEFVDVSFEWTTLANTYECRVVLCPEDEGGFSVHALYLPGVVSQGETADEAIENIREAFRGAVAAYADQHQSIPWSDSPVVTELPKGSKERWVLVDV